MNILNLKKIFITIKEDRKKITQQAKEEMVKSSENFNSTIQELIDFIKQKNTIKEKDNIVNLQKEVLKIINEINNTKIKSFKDCKDIIKYRTRFNYLINKFKNVIKDIDIPQELSDKFNLSLGTYRKSISDYLRVIKRQKNIQFMQLAVNLKRLTPKVEKDLIKAIRNEKRFNKNWDNAKTNKSIKLLNQFETYNSNISNLVTYLEESAAKESIVIIKSQITIVKLVTEMTTEFNSDNDYNKITKLRDKFNYQVRKIKNVIKDINIPQGLSDKYNLSLTLFRKAMSNYLKGIKNQKEMDTTLSKNNDITHVDTQNKETKNTDDIVYEDSFENNIKIDLITFESIKLIEKLDIFNLNLNRLVSYLGENNIMESSIIAKHQKAIIEFVTEISNTEPNNDNENKITKLKNKFYYQINMIKSITKKLYIPQDLIVEYNSALSSLKNAIYKYININNEQDNVLINSSDDSSSPSVKIESIVVNSVINNEDEHQSTLEDENGEVSLYDFDSSTINDEDFEERYNEKINTDSETALITDFKAYEVFDNIDLAFPNDLRSFLSLIKEELGKFKNPFYLMNINRKKRRRIVAFSVLMSILTSCCYSSHIETVYAQENENNPLRVTSIEDINTNEIDEALSSLVTPLEVDPKSLENSSPSNHRTPTINKAYSFKSGTIFKTNPITTLEMSHDVRERLMLTKEQLNTLLDSLCDPDGIGNVPCENREEALNFLYTHPNIAYAEKMLIIMARENLTYNELNEFCATMTYEGGPNNYNEGYNCASTVINRSTSIAWTYNCGTSIYTQLIRPGQFSAYEKWEIYSGRIDLPGYQGAIDALYTMQPSHNYLNFHEASESYEGKQLTDGGNEYANELTDDQRVERPYMNIIRQELAADERHEFIPELLKAAKLMLRKNPFK